LTCLLDPSGPHGTRFTVENRPYPRAPLPRACLPFLAPGRRHRRAPLARKPRSLVETRHWRRPRPTPHSVRAHGWSTLGLYRGPASRQGPPHQSRNPLLPAASRALPAPPHPPHHHPGLPPTWPPGGAPVARRAQQALKSERCRVGTPQAIRRRRDRPHRCLHRAQQAL